MGWRTDWLYRLIFREVDSVWSRAVQDGAGPFGPAPDYLVIEECLGANWEMPGCLPPVRRGWTYDAGELQVRPPSVLERAVPLVRRGMFWSVGHVRFHIRADRKKVILTWVVGPRCGRGMVLEVLGQGKRGTLQPAPDFNQWIA